MRPSSAWLRNHTYLVPLVLLVVAVALNYYFQPNFFQPRVLNGNLRVMLPLMVLAAGQALVIIAGGIDLSVGAMVSLVNVLLVTLVTHALPLAARSGDGPAASSLRDDP